MKLLSRLFGKSPAPTPAPAAAEFVVAPAPVAAPPPPAVDPAEHEQLLRSIGAGELDAAELARLAVDGATTRVRQAAAAAITDPAAWDELLPRLRGRDKAAYKLVKQRVDARAAERRAAGQAADEAAAACASLERLAGRAHDATYATSLAVLEARWRALPPIADDAVRQRGERALERAHEVVAAHERELARQAAERAAEQARERERAAAEQAQREAAAQRAAAEASERAAAEQARAAEAAERSAREAAGAQAHGEIASLVRLSGAALARGDTRKAARLRQSIEESLATAPALPPPLARGLEKLDARLNELRQWKDYVAAPKRIELIEEMEALVGVDEAPEALAEQIRALRQEWRTINKGITLDASAEAERFEQAYQAAFKPCQAHFAALAAARRENLEARRRVLERVLAFEARLDAPGPEGEPPAAPDYPLIARVLREAPQEWRGHSPVDRDAARALEADFHRALDRLRGRIDAWQAGNAADKQALVTRARQLGQLPDVARAVDEAKRLQAEWKSTGPVPHAQSQALWEEFRALCNLVFERRQQAFAAQSAALDQAKSQAEALCAQVEQAAKEPPADRQSGEARLFEWRDAFEALGELPRADVRSLRQRFQRAMERYEALLAGQEQREAAAAGSNLFEAARQVRAYQRAVLQGAADDEREALRGSAENFIAGVARWPGKGALQAVRQALARADAADFAATTPDEPAREAALRRLCVRAEILASHATPAEDVALRRGQELQMLQQGLGQARRIDERDWEAMRLEWFGVAAVDAELHDALERRFLRCLGTRR